MPIYIPVLTFLEMSCFCFLSLDIGVGAFPEGEEPEVAILDSQRTDSTLLSVKEHRAASRNAGAGEEPRSHH